LKTQPDDPRKNNKNHRPHFGHYALDAGALGSRRQASDRIRRLSESSSPGLIVALAINLCLGAEAYWYPLYCLVRSALYSREDAQDLTQAFFASLLEKITERIRH